MAVTGYHDRASAVAWHSPFKYLATRVWNTLVQQSTLSVLQSGTYDVTGSDGKTKAVHLPQRDLAASTVVHYLPNSDPELPVFNGEHDTIVNVVCNDILEEGVRFQRELKKVSDFNAHENPRVAVLDMASDLHPGGSYSTGSTSQEEDITDILNYIVHEHYPLAPGEGFFIPQVSYFRKDRLTSYKWMRHPKTLAVLVVPAVRKPELLIVDGKEFLKEPEVKLTKSSIWTQFKMAMDNHIDSVVLGAFGCGAFANPPEHIARIYSDVLKGNFKGVFSRVSFAVLPEGGRNHAAFTEVFSAPSV